MQIAPTPRALLGDAGEVCLQVAAYLLEVTEQSRFVLRVPELRDHVADFPGMHFHFAPDFVVGLGGRTRLEFMHEVITLERFEIAVIPTGIPHREVPLARAGEPFQNLVVSVYNQTIRVQFVRSEAGAQTLLVEHAHFDSAKDQLLVQYLEELGEIYHSREEQRHFGIKGLILTYLSTLAGIVQHAHEAPPSEKLKVSQAKRYVQEYLGSEELSVKYLAELLHCSADYLSSVFHHETGHRLISYINHERIKAARSMLRNTALSISEVAYALGFESQAYFSRVFKQVALKTPTDFRKSIEHSMVELEGRPHTICATRLPCPTGNGNPA
ncbi:MAG: AraC family transcriptional regulator [Chthoniobacter sp.]|uniref:helix-turn-helix transcriptional regulator n=1 Tax=Chthoniobacter sp. TaxID=2510640 RepID=UPI0032AD93A5